MPVGLAFATTMIAGMPVVLPDPERADALSGKMATLFEANDAAQRFER